MAIKLAFSTVACPDWSLEQTVTKAAEWDYSKNPPKAIWVCNNCGDETPRQIRDRNK